ncbi:Predicted ATP-dependent carboligase, ATP-grasp superfamily [Halovenus aranensis]|uniref:Predicted ATP-dependent carboligase, ATP-grasp superfamily n=1 Tax=Halovenus aranensis TaxID=890420 RepID=A0A1G8SMA6_9EURY|nr:carboxylate--amine ligase [Halovenus aranensis]SDJ30382.1 Predicted ATP-dependent carboligase, ATP-grasp superfamily [Halovenus aranensis]
MVAFHSHEQLVSAVADATFERPPALVANAHITGLSVARALSAHEVPVIAVDRTGDGVAPPSTHVDFAGEVTYPLDDRQAFREDVEAIATAAGTDLVGFGCMDEWVHALVDTEPDGVRLPFSGRAVIDDVLDKSSLYEIAEQLGVPYPETVPLTPETDAAAVTDRLGLPLVVKPALKREFEEAVGTNVIEVESEDDLRDVVDLAAEQDIEIMAQRRIDTVRGRDHSLASYRGPDGETLSLVGNARVRNPLDFGTSCLVERSSEPVIEERALAVLDEAGYHGISEAEFVYCPDREEYLLLDVNTRPWKWIGLPVAAGANLPYAAYADATDGTYEHEGVEDARWVYLPDYLDLLATADGFRDRLGRGDWTALVDGSFEDTGELTTAVYRPADPGPAYRALRTAVGGEEYYCAC